VLLPRAPALMRSGRPSTPREAQEKPSGLSALALFADVSDHHGSPLHRHDNEEYQRKAYERYDNNSL
jgi:hypothetical protein